MDKAKLPRFVKIGDRTYDVTDERDAEIVQQLFAKLKKHEQADQTSMNRKQRRTFEKRMRQKK